MNFRQLLIFVLVLNFSGPIAFADEICNARQIYSTQFRRHSGNNGGLSNEELTLCYARLQARAEENRQHGLALFQLDGNQRFTYKCDGPFTSRSTQPGTRTQPQIIVGRVFVSTCD